MSSADFVPSGGRITTESMSVRRDDLSALEPSVTRLHDLAAVPLRTHVRELGPWTRTTGQPARAVVVWDSSGEPLACAVLDVRVTRTPFGSGARVRLAGHDTLDHQRLVALHEGAAQALADGISGLLDRHRWWRCELELLPAGDPVAHALTSTAPWARTRADDPVPYVRWTRRDGERWAPKKARQKLRHAQRSAEETGRTTVTRLEGPQVLDALPATLDLRRERELALGRADALADPRERQAHVELVENLAARDCVELWQLHLDGALVAYLLAARDGACVRLLDGRMHPGHEAIAPGMILHGHALQAWYADPAIEQVDLGRGLNNFKRSLRTDDIETECTVLWSHAGLARADGRVVSVLDSLRSLVRAARDSSPAIARGVRAARLAQIRTRAVR